MAAFHLGDALTAEATSINQFIELLQEEQRLLKVADMNGLTPLIERKNLLSGKLANFVQERERELKRLGFPPGRPGMDAWLERSSQPNHRAAWQTLLQLAGRARDLNALNGKLIGLHMSHNQQAFDALMGASNRAMTYGPDGQQHTGLSGRILGKA